MSHIFLDSLGNIQFNEDYPTYHDHHQQCHYQEYPPSTYRFFITTFPVKAYVSYIFGNIAQLSLTAAAAKSSQAEAEIALNWGCWSVGRLVVWLSRFYQTLFHSFFSLLLR